MLGIIYCYLLLFIVIYLLSIYLFTLHLFIYSPFLYMYVATHLLSCVVAPLLFFFCFVFLGAGALFLPTCFLFIIKLHSIMVRCLEYCLSRCCLQYCLSRCCLEYHRLLLSHRHLNYHHRTFHHPRYLSWSHYCYPLHCWTLP